MDTEQERQRITAELARRHPLFARRTIERLVGRIYDSYRDARVRDFVPVLVRRQAEALLAPLDRDYRSGPGTAGGPHPGDPARREAHS